MATNSRIIIPSIHIKKEKCSDDEAENDEELLRYYDSQMAPEINYEGEMTIGDCDVDTDENLSIVEVVRKNDVSESATSKGAYRDTLAESIDRVARGLFESNDNHQRNAVAKKKMRHESKGPKRIKIADMPKRIFHKDYRKSKHLSDLLAKPFELNWRRELVYRAVNREGKRTADAYYFSPTGKKLRSLPEVAAYLENTNNRTLNINSFTFHKNPISNSPMETVRSAKPFLRKSDRVKNSYLENVWPEESSSSTLSKAESEKSDKQIKVDINGNPDVKCVATSTEDKEDIPPENEFKGNGICVLKDDEMDVPLIPEVKLNGEENVMESPEESGEDDIMQKCTNNCPGQEGIIPSLHCSMCLCLFHPRCIGLLEENMQILQFTCKECQIKAGHSIAEGTTEISKTVENTGLLSNHSPDTVLPQKLFILRTPLVSQQAQPLTKAPTSGIVKHHSSGVTIEKVLNAITKSGPTEPDAASISLIRVTQPSSIPVSNYTKPVLSKSNPNSNIKFIFPTQTQIDPKSSSGTLFVAPVGTKLTFVNNPTVSVLNSSSFLSGNNSSIMPLQSGDQNVIHLPVPMKSLIKQQTYSKTENRVMPVVIPNFENISNGTFMEHAYTNAYTMLTPKPASKEHAYTKTNQNRAPVAAIPSIPVGKICTLGKWNELYEGILEKIFGYFTLSDVIRASQVCQSWKRAVSHTSVWKHITLKNVRITSWERFGEIVRNNKTQWLDMRGMCLYDDKNRTWHEFASIVNDLMGLTRLDLGEVPAAIVHTIANTLTQLEGLTAESIVDSTKAAQNATGNCRLFIGKLCQMQKLTILRIRGVYGLHLPSMKFGLSCLECLTFLKQLSLTSIKFAIAPDLSFLKSLTSLVELELGDCNMWNEETYHSIGCLTQIRKLRLEYGLKSDNPGLLLSLKQLKSLVQLELILFHIPANLGDIFADLKNLTSLTIWPDMTSQAAYNNYNTLQALKSAPCLKSFSWGLVTSNLTATKPVDQLFHQANNIPFIVPTYNDCLTEGKINASVLMSKLRSTLQSSKVQVMMVPNASYSTIGCMPR